MNDHVAEKKKNTGALKRKSVFDNVQPMINNTEKATEEDKADSLLSQAFYMYEKNRSEQLNSSITELESTIQRHELYLKHFKGVDPSSLPHKKRKTIKKAPVPGKLLIYFFSFFFLLLYLSNNNLTYFMFL